MQESSPSMSASRMMMADAGMFALRLAIGATFINHGSQKLFTATEAMTKFFASQGFPAPGAMVLLAGIAEFVGGILLIAGLGTRFAAAAHVVVMVVAIAAIHGVSKWGAIELPVTLLASSLAILLCGAGGWSIDAWLARRHKSGADLSAKM